MSIVVKNLSISFDKDTLISEISFEIKNGEVAIVIGESGAGKSSLLNVIAGLKKPDYGSIQLNGKLICDLQSSLDPHKRNIGYVFQDFALFPNINAEKNIRFSENSNSKKYTVAGKHCESGDVLFKELELGNCKTGDLICVFGTGAYNNSMSSNYNRIPKPAAILVSNGESEIIQRRESPYDLLKYDVLPDRFIKQS